MLFRSDAFLVKEWLAADADAREAADGSLADGVSCDDAGCVVEAGGGGFITQALRGDALADDCKRAVLVVTARQPPVDCGASVIDLARLRRQGAKARWRCGASAMDLWSMRPNQTASIGRGRRQPQARARTTARSSHVHHRRARGMRRRRRPTSRLTSNAQQKAPAKLPGLLFRGSCGSAAGGG